MIQNNDALFQQILSNDLNTQILEISKELFIFLAFFVISKVKVSVKWQLSQSYVYNKFKSTGVWLREEDWVCMPEELWRINKLKHSSCAFCMSIQRFI